MATNERRPDPIDLMMNGKYNEAADAFAEIIRDSGLPDGDPMRLHLEAQIAFCREMQAIVETNERNQKEFRDRRR